MDSEPQYIPMDLPYERDHHITHFEQRRSKGVTICLKFVIKAAR